MIRNIKWRKKYPEKWNAEKQRYRDRNKIECGMDNWHRKWSETDLQLIFDKEFSDRELSKMLGRTIMSIQVQRCRLLEKI